MLRGLSRRLFGQFREGGIIRGRFTFTDSNDTWAASSDSYVGFTVADGGTGIVTVTFPDCLQVAVLHCELHNATVGTAANLRQVELPAMTAAVAKAGTFSLRLYKEDGTSGIPALSDPADGAVLEIVLYVDK